MRFLSLSSMVILAWPMTSFAGPREDALSVVDKWDKAFVASDVDGMVKLYAPDATFVGTSSKTPVIKAEGIRSYFENAFLTKFQSATFKESAATVLSDAAVLVTGLDVIDGMRDGRPVHAEGRVTFLVAKRGPDWQIVHFHRSAVPN
jgi:uncharacterized protein (TIGR02246 family)